MNADARNRLRRATRSAVGIEHAVDLRLGPAVRALVLGMPPRKYMLHLTERQKVRST